MGRRVLFISLLVAATALGAETPTPRARSCGFTLRAMAIALLVGHVALPIAANRAGNRPPAIVVDQDQEKAAFAKEVENALADRESAAIIWSTYDDRADFKDSPARNYSFFRTPYVGERHVDLVKKDVAVWMRRNSPRVPDENIETIDPKAPVSGGPNSLEAAIASALAKLANAERPRLYVSVNAHGLRAVICRQYGPDVSYDTLFSQIFLAAMQFETKHGKTPEIVVFADACFSGSAIESARRIFASKTGRYENGTGERFRLPITIYTASRDDELSYGNDFMVTLKDMRRTHVPFRSLQDSPLSRFAIGDEERRELAANRSSFMWWSSYDASYGHSLRRGAERADSTGRLFREPSGATNARLGGGWGTAATEVLFQRLEAATMEMPVSGEFDEWTRRLAANRPSDDVLLHWATSAKSPLVRLRGWTMLLASRDEALRTRATSELVAIATNDTDWMGTKEFPKIRQRAINNLLDLSATDLRPHALDLVRLHNRELRYSLGRSEALVYGAPLRQSEFLGLASQMLGRIAQELPALEDFSPSFLRDEVWLRSFLAMTSAERATDIATRFGKHRNFRELLLALGAEVKSGPELAQLLSVNAQQSKDLAFQQRAFFAIVPDWLELRLVHPAPYSAAIDLYFAMPEDKRGFALEKFLPEPESSSQAATPYLEGLLKDLRWTAAERTKIEERAKTFPPKK